MKRRMGVLVAVALAMPLVWTSTAEADGEPVAGFGVNGVVIDAGFSGGQPISVAGVVELADGSFAVSGSTAPTAPGGPSGVFLVKYLRSGQRDPSFGNNGFIQQYASSMVAFPDGRLLTTATNLSVVSSTGQISSGPNAGGRIHQMLPRPDGSVVAIGGFSFPEGKQFVARLILPNGVIDTTFNTDVESLFPRVTSASSAISGVIESDGRLIVSIVRPSATGFKGCTLVAFNPEGGLDRSFGTGGYVDTSSLSCVIDRFSDDSIRVLPQGSFGQASEYSADGVLLGVLAPPFNNPSLRMEGTGFSYAPSPAPAGQATFVAYDPAGIIDTTFGLNGLANLSDFNLSGFKLLDSGDLITWGTPVGNSAALALGLIHASFGTAPQPPALDTSKFVPVPPKRILDTRQGLGAPLAKVGVGGQVDLQIADAGGVPATDISAVVLNVTATNATQPGYVTAYPSGGRRPNASNVNLDAAGQTAANLVTVKVGSNGKVTLFSSGGTDLVADVAGYYTPVVTSTAGRLQTAAPQRILDTREGLGAPKAKPGPRAQLDVQVTGVGPVPSAGVSAVVLNVTADQATADGYVTVWPAGGDRPEVSNLNLIAGETRPNLVIVPVGADGKVSLFTQSGAELIADVAGWFTDATAADDSVGLFVPITPTRMLDTRQEPTAPTASNGTVTRLIGSTAVVPPDATVAVSANITATQATGAGFITAWPANATRPVVSNLNTGHAGQTIPNAAIVPLGNDQLGLYAQTGAQLIVDINGWYTNF